ncbi:bifunctional folylpolyglutamate synthase/dihydrofolate synthase [Piscinibacter defluvii]|uniref:bifunctional folylpolyglutamate synthase/dihydrofolate synthase n=1 Tax=Piscinibacter defluvii TaxID=1796922 RepID=UPI0013E2FBA9|nr:Mur ligase family protein [Piscinibacter defluvii]
MRVDLSPELDLLSRIGDPHEQFRSVHVAGTKGKGSVCALIEAGLLHAGWRAGRYASPHIEHVTERVSHLGRPIPEALLAAALVRALDARDAACRDGTAAREATWFDVVTAAAFWSFAEIELEWVVIEVGLGGLLDSTNVVLPELAIVTNVELEHTEILGKTVEAIAVQKAGIIKAGRPVLTPIPSSHAAGRVVRQAAEALAVDLTCIDLSRRLGLQAANLALARAALRRLGEAGVASPARGTVLGARDLPRSVALTARLPGRMEAFEIEQSKDAVGRRRRGKVKVVLDGAHVGFAIAAVIEELRRDPAYASDAVVLLALGSDKNADDFIGRLETVASHVICTQLPGDRRSWPADELARVCGRHGLVSESIGDPTGAFLRCRELIQGHSWILVTGSLHLVGAVRSRLRDWMHLETTIHCFHSRPSTAAGAD